VGGGDRSLAIDIGDLRTGVIYRVTMQGVNPIDINLGPKIGPKIGQRCKIENTVLKLA